MRITNTMLIKDMLWNANNNLNAMAKRQTEMSSGKRIHRPSDDPVGVTQVLKYKTDIREAEQYKKNVEDALGWLEVSETSLNSVKDILQRVRELSVQAANDSNAPEDKQKIAIEMNQLMKEVIVTGNATSAGRFIFSGLETDKKLFNDDGTYNLNMTSERMSLKRVINFEVAVGEVLPVGVHPLNLFGSVSSNSFFDGLLDRGTVTTSKSTQATLKTTVDLAHDFTSDTLDIQLGGVTYNVDESLFASDPLNPLTRERVVDAFRAATDGAVNLVDAADIYYDTDGALVIRAKAHGAATTVTDLFASTGVSGTATTPGTDAAGAVFTGTGALSDAAVAAETGTHRLTLHLDDQYVAVDVDFSALNTAADLETALQGAIDTKLPPPGTVTVAAADGAPLSLTISGTTDGQTHSLSVDKVVATRSELVTDMEALIAAVNTDDKTAINGMLAKIDVHMDRILSVAGEIGGKTNRVAFIKDRVEENTITFTGLLSKVQDIDYTETIMYFKNLENIYRASLSVGSKVIQPTLVDFIR